MNRVKKEFKKKGLPLQNDYPSMPHYIRWRLGFLSPAIDVLLKGITVRYDGVLIRELEIGIENYRLNRDGSISYRFISEATIYE